jgi:hypothetical protein
MRSTRSGSPRLRLAVGAGAMLTTGVLVARVAAAAGTSARLALVVGLVALALQGLAVTRRPEVAGPVGGMLGAFTAAPLLTATNRGAAVELVVLFLTATELASWAGRLRSVVAETGASVRRQLGEIGAVVALGGLVCAGVLGAARVNGPSGRVALVVGLVAAVVPVALLAARRTRLGER